MTTPNALGKRLAEVFLSDGHRGAYPSPFSLLILATRHIDMYGQS